MIKRIEIRGYKKIGNSSLFLDALGTINYLVGKNNSGKSSILEALSLATIGLVNNQPASHSSRIRDTFTDPKDALNKDEDATHLYVKFIDEEGVESTFEAQAPADESDPTTSQHSTKFPRTFYIKCSDASRRVHGTTGEEIVNQIKSRGVIEQSSIPDWVYYKESILTDTNGGSKNVGSSEKFNLLKNILSSVLDIQLEDIDKSPYNNEIFFKYREPKTTVTKKLYLLGSGTKSFINICAAGIYLDDADIILIDEPEIHLHASLESKLPAIFSELSKLTGKQFIIATQSPFLMANIESQDNVYLCKDGTATNLGKGEKIGKNAAVAMELGSDDPRAIGAPENYVLLEESSLQIILEKASSFYGNKDIVFISCAGNANVSRATEALKNMDDHNLLLKCNPIYFGKYFVVVDSIDTDDRKRKTSLESIRKTIIERFIELPDPAIEMSYLSGLIEAFKAENKITIEIDNWINEDPEWPKPNLRKTQLALHIANEMTQEQFEQMFPSLKVIFE